MVTGRYFILIKESTQSLFWYGLFAFLYSFPKALRPRLLKVPDLTQDTVWFMLQEFLDSVRCREKNPNNPPLAFV